MKMRWGMIVIEHGDHEAINHANHGQGLPHPVHLRGVGLQLIITGKASSRQTTRSCLCSCGLLNDGTIVMPSSLRAGIDDASFQGSDVTRPVDALEAGVGALFDELAVVLAAVECLAPGTYEDDLAWESLSQRTV